MPFVPVPKTAFVEIQMSFQGQLVENTFYVSSLNVWDAADLEELCQTIVVWWQEECIPLYSNSVILVAVKATSLENATAPVWEESVPSTNVGAIVSPALPNNVMFTVTFLTALHGRNYRGRNYITGLAEDRVTGNSVNAAHADGWIAAYNDLFGRINLLNRFMVVVSKFSGKDAQGKPLPRATGLATPVTGFRLFDYVIDSQRRRLPGRGS